MLLQLTRGVGENAVQLCMYHSGAAPPLRSLGLEFYLSLAGVGVGLHCDRLSQWGSVQAIITWPMPAEERVVLQKIED